MPAGGAVHTRGAARWISGKETGSGVLAGLVGFLRAPVVRRLCLAPLAPISLWVPTSETWLPRRLCRAPGQSGARTGTVSRTVPDLAAPTAGRQLGGLYVRVTARAGVLSCVLASVHASVRACVLASVRACWCLSVMLTSAHACWRPCAPAYVRGGVRPCVLAPVRACWRPHTSASVRAGVHLRVPASARAGVSRAVQSAPSHRQLLQGRRRPAPGGSAHSGEGSWAQPPFRCWGQGRAGPCPSLRPLASPSPVERGRRTAWLLCLHEEVSRGRIRACLRFT